MNPWNIQRLAQQRNTAAGVALVEQQLALHTQSQGMVGAERILLRLGDQYCDGLLSRLPVTPPEQHSRRANVRDTHVGGMSELRGLVDGLPRHADRAISKAPQPQCTCKGGERADAMGIAKQLLVHPVQRRFEGKSALTMQLRRTLIA